VTCEPSKETLLLSGKEEDGGEEHLKYQGL
jgi:hypothetical protein